MTLEIAGIRARPVAAPIRRAPISASGATSHAALVLVDLETEAGVTGRPYLFTFLASMLKRKKGSVPLTRALRVLTPFSSPMCAGWR